MQARGQGGKQGSKQAGRKASRKANRQTSRQEGRQASKPLGGHSVGAMPWRGLLHEMRLQNRIMQKTFVIQGRSHKTQ